MKKSLEETKDYYYEHYFEEDKAERIKESVLNKVKRKKAKTMIGKKLIYSSSIAVVFIGILIGSAFTFPVVSKVLAQLPLLNALFDDDSSTPILSMIGEELDQMDFKMGTFNLNIQEKSLNVGIQGNKKYFNDVKEDVKQNIIELLQSKRISTYKVNVFHEPKGSNVNHTDKKSEELKVLENSIREKLDDLDYKAGKVTLFPKEKIISIGIEGNETYFHEVKDSVEKVIQRIIKTKRINAYKTEIFHEIEGSIVDNMPNKRWQFYGEYSRKSVILQSAIMSELKKKGFDIVSARVRINESEKFIPLEIPVSETRTSEIKKTVNNLLQEKELAGFTTKIYKIDPEKESVKERWLPLLTTLTVGLTDKVSLKVENVGFSFSTSSVVVNVSTSVKSTENKVKEIGEKIENIIQRFLKSDEVKDSIKNDSYEIKIYSKDKKIIN